MSWNLTLVVAGIAALAILLIAFGWRPRAASGISARLERYAAAKPDKVKSTASGQGAISDLIAQSTALASLNKVVEQRDFGANLARDLARADLKLKPREFLLIWGGSIVGVPVVMLLLSVVLPASATRCSCSSAAWSGSGCHGSGWGAARAAG